MANNNYGIRVSEPGVNALSSTAPEDFLMDTQNPFMKIDSTNSNAFKTITLTFNNDPPNPGAGGTLKTKVYSFAHGYDYIPRFWALMFNQTPPTVSAYAEYSYADWALVGQNTIGDMAWLSCDADATNINFYITKYYTMTAVNLIGCVLLLRCYEFVDGVAA